MDTQNFPSYNFVDIITLLYFHLNVKRESGNDKFTIGRGKNNGNYSKEGLNVIVILKVSQSIVYEVKHLSLKIYLEIIYYKYI